MANPGDLRSLSDREEQVLEYAVSGLTDQAIANRLGISLATVSTYWARIRQKVGPHSRSELVAMFVQLHAESQLESLRLENERLIDSLEELAQDQLFQSLQTLIDTTHEGIILVDEAGIIVMSNEIANSVFRAGEAGLVGRDVIEFVPEGSRESHDSHRRAFMAAPHHLEIGEHRALPGIRCDGELFAFSASLNGLQVGRKRFVTCVMRELPVGLILPRYGATSSESE